MTANTTSGLYPAVVRIIDLQTASFPLDSSVVFEAVQTSNGTMISVQVPLTAIMTTVQGSLPTGGGTGQILNKSSGSNFATQWVNVASLVTASTGLASSGSTTIALALGSTAGLSVLGVTGSATLVPAAIVGVAAQVLRVNDAGTGLAFGAVNLASAVTGVLSVPNGGTSTSILTAHAVLLGEGTSTLGFSVPSTAGNLLIDQGAAVDPAFKAIAGDVTISANGTTTIGNNVVSNAKAAQMAALTIKGNNTSSIANAADLTVAQAFALLGIAIEPGGRLSLTSGVPVTESDVTGATAVFLTQQDSLNTVIFDGSSWQPRTYAGELTLALDTTGHPVNSNFDVFEFYNSTATAVFLGTGPVWTSDVSRGSGAGTTEIEVFQGRMVNKNTITLRNNSVNYTSLPVRTCNLRGGFRTVLAGQTEDSAAKRLLWDLYRPVPKSSLRVDTTAMWACLTAVFRQANGSAVNQVSWLAGVSGREVSLTVSNWASGGAGIIVVAAGIGIDSTTTNSAQIHDDLATGTAYLQLGAQMKAVYFGYPGLGYHTGVWLESGGASATFYGSNNSVTKQSGIGGTVIC